MIQFVQKTWVLLTIACALGLLACPSHGRPTDRAIETRHSGLDDRLLESLDDQPQQAAPAIDGKDAESRPTVEPLEPVRTPKLPNVLREREDLGQPGSGDPLLRIGQQMRQAQQRIAGEDTSPATQTLQQQVVDDLTQLILQMQKKCNGQCQSQGKRPSTSPKPKASRRPARDSVTGLDQQAPKGPDPAAVRHLNRRVWGDLPAALRQGVLNADFEQFLPKYEKLIEEYFRRLAEETDSQP